MPKRPTFESANRRLEHLRRGIDKRWHVMASDGDFIEGFDGKYKALAAANMRNVLSAKCQADIVFEVKDTKETKRFRGEPMRPGNIKTKAVENSTE